MALYSEPSSMIGSAARSNSRHARMRFALERAAAALPIPPMSTRTPALMLYGKRSLKFGPAKCEGLDGRRRSEGERQAFVPSLCQHSKTREYWM